MNYDRILTISVGNNRKSTNWQAVQMTVAELYQKLSAPTRSTETINEYFKLPKAQKDALKDVGGFVGGSLNGTHRKSNAVTGRDLITLDFDNIPGWQTETIVERVEGFNCNYCIYSTRKHIPSAPRLRVIFPLDRTVSADEYEPIARRMAEYIGIAMADATTFDVSRLMYWPSCCSDSEYVFKSKDAPFISADGILATYADWHDFTAWPQVPNAVSYAKLAMKQGDPEEKKGVVGAFCRTYDVYSAMEAYLPNIYESCDTSDERFTYLGGSTTGGAVIYEHGKFLFSHHATDPCSGRLVNAFDLVRLHKFGDKDAEANPDTPAAKLPSFKAMSELALQDSKVVGTLNREQRESAIKDFEGIATDNNAVGQLADYKGRMITLEAVELALLSFGITVRNNLVTGRPEIQGLPKDYSAENAANTLPIFIVDKMRLIGIKGCSKNSVSDYLAVVLDKNRYSPVLDMLHTTVWDGISRLHELYKIIGISPGSFEATLVFKWLLQCIALAHNTEKAGYSAAGVLTLQGVQGVGKTQFFKQLALNPTWFVEGASIDLKSKDSIISATRSWICELGEVDSTLQRDQSSLKAFITSATDKYRAPYAREETFKPRCTSFCATVNPGQFLRDVTGDRRFWVIPIKNIDLNALFSLSDEWKMQLWAECYTAWKIMPLGYHLTDDEKRQLELSNKRFRELKPGEEEIRQAMRFDLPQDQWCEYTASELQSRLCVSNKYSSRQIGFALAKIEREEKQVTSRVLHGVRFYNLPIPKGAQSDFTGV